jgi:hypothetical protein
MVDVIVVKAEPGNTVLCVHVLRNGSYRWENASDGLIIILQIILRGTSSLLLTSQVSGEII